MIKPNGSVIAKVVSYSSHNTEMLMSTFLKSSFYVTVLVFSLSKEVYKENRFYSNSCHTTLRLNLLLFSTFYVYAKTKTPSFDLIINFQNNLLTFRTHSSQKIHICSQFITVNLLSWWLILIEQINLFVGIYFFDLALICFCCCLLSITFFLLCICLFVCLLFILLKHLIWLEFRDLFGLIFKLQKDRKIFTYE